LPFVSLAEQWREIEAGLPADWARIRLELVVAEDERADRAAIVLGPLTPGRTGAHFRLDVERGRGLERVLDRLDGEGIRGRLDLAEAVETERAEPPARPVAAPRTILLTAQWDELVRRLPPDWSDLYAEIELHSSDFLERGALLLAPVNPARYGGPLAFRFRCAREKGYGVAAVMARRCLERLDAERITGTVQPLRVLAHTALAATQGPVWRVGGRSV
jgi:hypothetical protein